MFTSIFDFFRWTLCAHRDDLRDGHHAAVAVGLVHLARRGATGTSACSAAISIVHGLRLRFKAFWGDVIISLLLCVVFLHHLAAARR